MDYRRRSLPMLVALLVLSGGSDRHLHLRHTVVADERWIVHAHISALDRLSPRLLITICHKITINFSAHEIGLIDSANAAGNYQSLRAAQFPMNRTQIKRFHRLRNNS